MPTSLAPRGGARALARDAHAVGRQRRAKRHGQCGYFQSAPAVGSDCGRGGRGGAGRHRRRGRCSAARTRAGTQCRPRSSATAQRGTPNRPPAATAPTQLVRGTPVPSRAAQRSAAASQTVLKMSSRCSQPLTPEIYSAALEPSRVPFHRPAPWPASAALEPQARALACLGRACALARAEPAEHRSTGVAVWYKRGTAGTRRVVRIAAPLWAKGRPGALVGPSRARPSTSARIGRGCGDALLWVEPLRRG